MFELKDNGSIIMQRDKFQPYHEEEYFSEYLDILEDNNCMDLGSDFGVSSCIYFICYNTLKCYEITPITENLFADYHVIKLQPYDFTSEEIHYLLSEFPYLADLLVNDYGKIL